MWVHFWSCNTGKVFSSVLSPSLRHKLSCYPALLKSSVVPLILSIVKMKSWLACG